MPDLLLFKKVHLAVHFYSTVETLLPMSLDLGFPSVILIVRKKRDSIFEIFP